MNLSCEPTLSRLQKKSGSAENLTSECLNVVRFDYTWKNIVSGDARQPHITRSPVFTIDSSGSRTRWSLRLYPAGVHFNEGYMALFLRCESSEKPKVEARFRFYANYCDRGPVTSPEMEKYCVFECGTNMASHGYNMFCLRKDFPFHNIGRIRCEIEMLLKSSNIADQGAGELRNDIAAVFLAGEHSDFAVINRGISFPVHKVILSARSSVFASMLKHDTEEQRKNSVDIEDMNPEALEEMLRFIYTGKVNKIEKFARDLLPAAEKYALDRLRIMCEEALSKILDKENAADILILADIYRANKLKARAIDFIKEQTVDVMITSGFEKILASHQHLTAEILRALASKRE